MEQESFGTAKMKNTKQEGTSDDFFNEPGYSEEPVTEVASIEGANEAGEIDRMSDSFEPSEEAVSQAYVEGWESERQLPEVRDYLKEKQGYAESVYQWDEYIEKATVTEGTSIDSEQLESSLNTREDMQRKLVEVSANYPGDWTGLLYRRMADPLAKEKFIAQRTEAMPAMQEGEVGMFDKAKRFKDYYQSQNDSYDETLSKVFSHTRVNNERPHVLGSNSGIGDPGVVYFGAHHEDGSPLTPRQKNIIEAHEKGHGLRDFESPIDAREIRSIIDGEAFAALTQVKRQEGASGYNPNYILEPAEIIERMAQFKNYFGMGATEPFTKKHLDHIRNQYVTDTGLDNSVSDLLTCVTSRTEQAFLKVINKYPI